MLGNQTNARNGVQLFTHAPPRNGESTTGAGECQRPNHAGARRRFSLRSAAGFKYPCGGGCRTDTGSRTGYAGQAAGFPLGFGKAVSASRTGGRIRTGFGDCRACPTTQRQSQAKMFYEIQKVTADFREQLSAGLPVCHLRREYCFACCVQDANAPGEGLAPYLLT